MGDTATVRDFLVGRNVTSTQEIMRDALGMPEALWNDKIVKQLCRLLRSTGEWKPEANKARGQSRRWVRVGVAVDKQPHLPLDPMQPPQVRCFRSYHANAIKIGRAADPNQRLSDLQVANPYRLELIAMFVGDPKAEFRLHARFKDYRLEGEWFKAEPILAWLKEVLA